MGIQWSCEFFCWVWVFGFCCIEFLCLSCGGMVRMTLVLGKIVAVSNTMESVGELSVSMSATCVPWRLSSSYGGMCASRLLSCLDMPCVVGLLGWGEPVWL